jgi:hypothetical protein
MTETLVNPGHVLSDENKTKVCLITDINKAALLLLKRQIEPEEFDELYDLSIKRLETVLEHITSTLRFQMHIRELAGQVFSMRRPKHEEDGN